MEYNEIKKLKEYCDKIGVINTLWEYLDGFVLKFNVGDAIQNCGSINYGIGCIEFGLTGINEIDYKSTSLRQAKAFVKRYKAHLNKEAK